MEGVEPVAAVDDRHLHWVAEVGGEAGEWDAEITEQVPEHTRRVDDDRGQEPRGVVNFHKLFDDGAPRSWSRWAGSPRARREGGRRATAWASGRVRGDLERFKD